jgi:hypothetical protein
MYITRVVYHSDAGITVIAENPVIRPARTLRDMI